MKVTIPSQVTDFLIIGSGIAGLRAAIELAPHGEVCILCKDEPSESNTEYAQGGIAVALSDEDEVRLHYQDTMAAGDGLCNPEAVKILVEEGPHYIIELIDWGTEFDREGTKLDFTREGAHSKNRILHAHGDSTGKEIIRALLKKAKSYPSIHFYPQCYTKELMVEDDRCLGVIYLNENEKSFHSLYASATLLATGGAGRVYSQTTNPPFATGDGMAIAFRGGTTMMDMEFVQFHPTSLFLPHSPRFLLSESLRGEGAYLKNIHGKRFMENYHPLAELAPRDVVSRAIISETKKTNASWVYLDLTHLKPSFVRSRFPKIFNTCFTYNLDLAKDMIPVNPAAHYMMGGVKTDLWGRTTLSGLYAAGEIACTGVHGANRLASNSLLEGLVYGARSGKDMASDRNPRPSAPPGYLLEEEQGSLKRKDFERIRQEINNMMWDKVGIMRDKVGLEEAIEYLKKYRHLSQYHPLDRYEMETINIYLVGLLIAVSALRREESRGAHYRKDFPQPDDKKWKLHSTIHKGSVEF